MRTLPDIIPDIGDQLKRKQVRVYLDPDHEKALAKVCKLAPTLSESSIMTILLDSALKAVESNGWKIPLPLTFRVVDEQPIKMSLPSSRQML
jgi:uncharacterized membrane-anchored protein